MLFDAWRQFNSEIISSLKTYKFETERDNALNTIVECIFIKTNASEVYGSLGEKLKSFLSHVNFDHPEMHVFVKNILGDESIKEIEQFADLANYCKRKGYDSVAPKLKLMLSHFVKSSFFLNGKTLGNPAETNTHIRFLKNSNLWHLREKKKCQKINVAIDSEYDYKKIDESILCCYHHNSQKTEQLRTELLRKKRILEKMNCRHLLDEINTAINKLNNEICAINMGFRRITLGNVASSLKKIDPSISDIHIFPLTENQAYENNSIKTILSMTENFPAFGSKFPVFDHYGVVRGLEQDYGLLVGERDSRTFFLGYYMENKDE
jgi:hypothetical protein